MSGNSANYLGMLNCISKEIKIKNVGMDLLKFTLADFVRIRTRLERATSAFDLFKELDTGNHISETNLKVVIAMLKLLGLDKIRNVIVKLGFPNPDVDPKDVFTPFRIRLVKIGINITLEKVTEIAGLREVPEYACKNQWQLLQYLMDNKCGGFGVLKSESLSKFLEDAGITEQLENQDNIFPALSGAHEVQQRSSNEMPQGWVPVVQCSSVHGIAQGNVQQSIFEKQQFVWGLPQVWNQIPQGDAIGVHQGVMHRPQQGVMHGSQQGGIQGPQQGGIQGPQQGGIHGPQQGGIQGPQQGGIHGPQQGVIDGPKQRYDYGAQQGGRTAFKRPAESACMFVTYDFDLKRQKKTEIPREEKYDNFLLRMSECYRGEGFYPLRFCLYDIVPKGTLKNCTSASHLFKELDNKGEITVSNIKILSDIAELTEIKKAKDIVKEYKENDYVDKEPEGKKLTDHRRRLFKTIRAIGPEELETISGNYHSLVKKYDNKWEVVFELEQQNLLNSDQVKKFLRCLSAATQKEYTEPVAQRLQPKAKSNNPTESVQGLGLQAKADNTHSVDQDKFLDLLTEVARWYDTRKNIGIVKVLLRGILKENFDRSTKSCMDFFYKLNDIGVLGSNNLTILYEVISCSGQFGLSSSIAKFVQCPDLKNLKIDLISEFRIKLKKFGSLLQSKDIDIIDGLYNMPKKRYTDPWEMILDLEEEQQFPLTEDGLPKFIERLKNQKLAYACKALE